jgi:hypothetical protein
MPARSRVRWAGANLSSRFRRRQRIRPDGPFDRPPAHRRDSRSYPRGSCASPSEPARGGEPVEPLPGPAPGRPGPGSSAARIARTTALWPYGAPPIMRAPSRSRPRGAALVSGARPLDDDPVRAQLTVRPGPNRPDSRRRTVTGRGAPAASHRSRRRLLGCARHGAGEVSEPHGRRSSIDMRTLTNLRTIRCCFEQRRGIGCAVAGRPASRRRGETRWLRARSR